MSERGGWLDVVTDSDSRDVIRRLRQFDRRLQIWTNERLSSDLFFGWVLGYLVKGPVELTLAFLVASTFTAIAYFACGFALAYEISTVQLLQADISITAVVFTTGTHCELSNDISTDSTRETEQQPTDAKETTGEANESSEIEA